MILKPFEVCPYADVCVHNKAGFNVCPGARKDRPTTFVCKLNPYCNSVKNEFHSSLQKTGKEQLILENNNANRIK